MSIDYYVVFIQVLRVFDGKYECLQIRNSETSNCLDTLGGKAGQPLGMGYCHGMGGNQVCKAHI